MDITHLTSFMFSMSIMMATLSGFILWLGMDSQGLCLCGRFTKLPYGCQVPYRYHVGIGGAGCGTVAYVIPIPHGYQGSALGGGLAVYVMPSVRNAGFVRRWHWGDPPTPPPIPRLLCLGWALSC